MYKVLLERRCKCTSGCPVSAYVPTVCFQSSMDQPHPVPNTTCATHEQGTYTSFCVCQVCEGLRKNSLFDLSGFGQPNHTPATLLVSEHGQTVFEGQHTSMAGSSSQQDELIPAGRTAAVSARTGFPSRASESEFVQSKEYMSAAQSETSIASLKSPEYKRSAVLGELLEGIQVYKKMVYDEEFPNPVYRSGSSPRG